ncbi:MAG: helix-turn-helix domain-containing protein [Bacilli bacterium]|nr:helix-turn-helix domain-containing protein [Bacilli bacterium]
MRNLRTFAESAMSLIQEGVNEVSRMIKDFDTTRIVGDMMEFNNSIREEFDKIKEKIKNLNDKFVVDVLYDRDEEILNYTIEDNRLVVFVRKDAESNEDNTELTQRRVTTALPNDIDITQLKTKYDAEEKMMSFIFKKVKNEEVEETTTEDNNAVEDESNVTSDSIFDNKMAVAEQMKARHDNGMSYRQIAREFGTSDKTVARWIRDFEATL